MPNFPAAPDSTEPPLPPSPQHPCTPPELNPVTWDSAGRALLAKMLGEFAYEEIVSPVPAPAAAGDAWTLTLDDGSSLGFRARRRSYGSWQVAPDTITLTPAPPSTAHPTAFGDPYAFLVRARTLLGLDGATLGHLIRELSATLTADARIAHTALTADVLADLDYADLEGHQTGHPWLVLNKGRIGLSAADTAAWAPEARTRQRLPWLAAHTSLAEYRGTAGLEDPARLYSAELDPVTRAAFDQALRSRGLDPRGYLYLPVHPWQWDEVVLPLFAPALASSALVPLPADPDVRLPQQSIRTFLNLTRPDRHSVKLPLSVFNTMVWRGLPSDLALAAPAVTAWIHSLRDADPFLREECGVVLLGEVASVTVRHPVYEQLPEVPYQYKELLGAIWREPLAGHLAPGERARTLASLLHTDPRGRSFTAELVARSGLTPTVWLQRLFAALLPPLLRFLYRYGTVFSPHGENAIVIFDEQDVPVRLAVKDFVDDVNISREPLPEHASMPDEVRAALLTEPPAYLTQFIHSGLFIGVFRYLAALCEDRLGVPETEFWSLVRAEIIRHQARFPELKDRYELFDLLTERLDRLCPNRNRLHKDGYRDRPDRPHVVTHGTVANPLYRP
ncbi:MULTISPECIES: IucA/IucC family siderophore biosynthesis protein [unclassified Streptomyces]|uniref:IucA/IucC family protein n=1 Tax=unclassified Streptomyces TaxID=2593676 RepID=UPI0022519F8F|nr:MULTISPECIES: IucA/IucC family siderophore biosynthesis protein [unclassified Streptomyces]MCX4528516.1 IucA/IucC family siderophore biosynthesis protein [Streptomyces sp. NBC_01551]MCX4540886.1 IucA/IucC family siderophore biosynthesis protein [Streptomyces sp. NBC_01565]